MKVQLCIVLALAPVILGDCQAKPAGQACVDVLAHPPAVPQIDPAKDLPMMKVTPETTQSFADFGKLDPLAMAKACGNPRCATLMSVSLVADKVTQKTTSVLVLCKSPDNQTVPLSYTPAELTAGH